MAKSAALFLAEDELPTLEEGPPGRFNQSIFNHVATCCHPKSEDMLQQHA